MSNLKETVLSVIKGQAEAMGYCIANVVIFGKDILAVQIFLERVDLSPVNIDDCVKFSKKIALIIEEADIFSTRYTLEVSSMGINRALLNMQDFIRFTNKNVTLKTKKLINGQKNFKGILEGIKGSEVLLRLDNNEKIEIDFSLIDKANLDMLKEINIAGGTNDKHK